jgi:hypothetical protein
VRLRFAGPISGSKAAPSSTVAQSMLHAEEREQSIDTVPTFDSMGGELSLGSDSQNLRMQRLGLHRAKHAARNAGYPSGGAGPAEQALE